MRIAITGASGNVGTALLRALAVAHPEGQVVGICRRPPHDAFPDVHWRAIDLAAPSATVRLQDAFTGADAVVHLAWAIQPVRRRKEVRQVNVGGTRAVLRALGLAGVPHLVHASSLGAYAPSPCARVSECWPTIGISTSAYSQDKVSAERDLDVFASDHPDVAVARIRPSLIAQREAAVEIARFFLGRFFPLRAVRALRGRLPVLPVPAGLRLEFVHADDVAAAVVRILDRRATGAFNLGGDQPLTPGDIAGLFGARPLLVPQRLGRLAVGAGYRLRALPIDAGWYDLAVQSPLLDDARARTELGWAPRHSSRETAAELVDGMADRATGATPALHG